jgi:putative ABC transport system permease protein
MLGYYGALALRSLRKNLALTALMILAIAFGVGASMTMLTVLRVLAADPLPGASQDVYYVQLDPRRAEGYRPGDEPADLMTRYDGEALLRARRADRQALMSGGRAAIDAGPEGRAGLDPFFVEARWTSADFFPMFRVPFVAGGPWSADDDAGDARVVVITRELADRLFGSINVVGKTVTVDNTALRVVGVLGEWRPAPRFYDLRTARYGQPEQIYAPFSTSRALKLRTSGTMSCWDEYTDQHGVDAPCIWAQLWVELDSAEKADGYEQFLLRYAQDALAAGRYHRPPNVRLRNVMDHLAFREVVPSDVRLQTWIALAFLLVCLINTVGLLLTKFLRRAPEIGVRRALGASKRSIFIQLLVEAGAIGLVGGAVGLGLAWLGLAAVRAQPTDYASLASLDLPMTFATFALSVVASLLAGLLPAWRGCHVTPALQLKSH